jgi:hypothetical protein
MTNRYLLKLVASIERLGNSARFQRLERETNEMIEHAKANVDNLIAEASMKSEKLAYATHAARLAYLGRETEWVAAEGDAIQVHGKNTLESLQLTGVKVTISRSGTRMSKIIITTPDDFIVEIAHTGSATLLPEDGLGYPLTTMTVSHNRVED